MVKAKRYSAKREAILETIRKTDTHPTAEWLFQQLKPKYPDLSLGTVYRNITAFQEEGLVRSVGVVNGQERFDGNVRPHTHFVCTCCGRVCDLCGLDVPEELASAPARTDGVRVDHYQLTFQGVCKACLAKEDRAG